MKSFIIPSIIFLGLSSTQAGSLSSYSPLSNSSRSYSPTTLKEKKFEIQALSKTFASIFESPINSFTIGFSYGLSNIIKLNSSYSTQYYSTSTGPIAYNIGALRGHYSHHFLLGLETTILQDYASGYFNLGQGYHPKSLFTDASFGVNLGYTNKYLTPFINLEYGYSLPYHQKWVSDKENVNNTEDYQAGNSHIASAKVGLETQFGSNDLGLKLHTGFSLFRLSTKGYKKNNLSKVNNITGFTLSTGVSYAL